MKTTETARVGKAIWKQTLALAKKGDIRAIKLCFDRIDKREKEEKLPEVRYMAEIRRAVFGDAVMDAERIVAEQAALNPEADTVGMDVLFSETNKCTIEEDEDETDE